MINSKIICIYIYITFIYVYIYIYIFTYMEVFWHGVTPSHHPSHSILRIQHPTVIPPGTGKCLNTTCICLARRHGAKAEQKTQQKVVASMNSPLGPLPWNSKPWNSRLCLPGKTWCRSKCELFGIALGMRCWFVAEVGAVHAKKTPGPATTWAHEQPPTS